MEARGELGEGLRALEESRWDTARRRFDAVLAGEESAEALDGLGLALWFLGETANGIASRERAFGLYVADGRCDDAARTAVWVSHQHFVAGRASAARGWLARAERALEGVPVCAGHGWVAVEQARHAPTSPEQITHASRAVEIARSSRAADLEVFAVSLLGRAEMSAGHVERGLSLLEEAMAAATAGRVRNVHTLAEAYCNLIMACTGAGEWERATEWCEVVDEFARTHDAAPLFGTCRSVHADVLVATGHWPEAERALESALDTHARYVPEMGAPSVASLAELRVHQGRLAEAERLLAGREEHPSSLRALALLRTAEGRREAAVSLLERGLEAAVGDVMRTTQQLAALADARLASGDLDGARSVASSLADLASGSGIRLVSARAELAAARVARADGGVEEATKPASRALGAFLALAMPLDAGQARLELAHSLAGRSPESAVEEARAALEIFRELGAPRAMDAAAALLRRLGSSGRGSHHLGGVLTVREQEVLGLIALGRSNAQIAETLVISEKTAGHHVSHILTKLGVRNRTEAAAHAPRPSP
ncbi:MAG: LuxR C-terminal-related transcriptional regulator [Nocardioides sp.]